ncbi:MAG: T9SS type A sorting domain-containing protein [Ignavibacteriae bacterium]|nr:T9SS type A sorting domain-containing protein [Ignavibacteriota bacterium]MCB9243755.1 T9SS type A sorting domain-containing protein [Ignavibacteriales bacterium]
MKSIKIFLAVIVLTLVSLNSSQGTIHIIEVVNFNFAPSSVNAVVGDTIKWMWISGSHTTTCDGSTGTSRPAGADPWNQPMNSGSSTFSYVIMVAGTYNYKCIPHFPSMVGTINATVSSISQTSSSIPERYSLYQNYPNPFNPSTNIKFDIVKGGFTSLTIYNLLGQKIAELVNTDLSPGFYEASWDASEQTSGVYIYKLQSNDFTETRKLTLLK